MIVIGVDVHKHSLTATAVDELGRALAERSGPIDREVVAWARALGEDRLWAVEDCRHVTNAVFDNDSERIKEFVNEQAPLWAASREAYDPPPPDWATYLYDSSRNAVAHAVRAPGKPVLDPDIPADRARLWTDSGLLDDLVRTAISQRWERPVRFVRRPGL